MPSLPSSPSPVREGDHRKRRRASYSRSPERQHRRRHRSPPPRSDKESERHDRERISRHSRHYREERPEDSRTTRRDREDRYRDVAQEEEERPDLRRIIKERSEKKARFEDEKAADANGTTAPVAAPPAVDVVRKAPAKGRAGGVYVPPWKQAQLAGDLPASTDVMERQTWDALRKSLNGHVNKVTAQNIRSVVKELFRENIIRGRGLLCRSLMRSQMASPTFTPVYAAMAAVVNTMFPHIIELLLHRLVQQWKRSYKRNDKAICSAALKFLAHLTNQEVVHEMLVLDLIVLMLDLDNLTDDSVEMALGLFREVGQYLAETSPAMLQEILNIFRRVLQEGAMEQRTRFLVEGMLLQARDRFKEFPQIAEGLDLTAEDDRKTHEIFLLEAYPTHIQLDVFKHNPKWEEEERAYNEKAAQMLGSDSEAEGSDEDADGGDSSDEDDESDEGGAAPEAMQISDMTETNLINLRRTIYLTIMSAMSFEEAGHKLIKIELAPGQEIEIVTMLIECCSQEKTYLKYYGLVAQRFCYLTKEYQALFEDCFTKQYMLIHRLETNKLRNVARMFAHLLSTDAISWGILSVIRVTEDDTTSSSRIFIKILFQDLSENMGMKSLNERLQDPAAAGWFQGIFPHDMARNIRFSINFFTSIGLGGLTDKMRADLAEMPKIAAAQQAAAAKASGSDDSSSSDDDSSSSDSSGSSSSSSSGSDSDSSSDGESPPPKRKARAPARQSSRRAEKPSSSRRGRTPREHEVHYPPPPPMPASNGRPKLKSVVATA